MSYPELFSLREPLTSHELRRVDETDDARSSYRILSSARSAGLSPGLFAGSSQAFKIAGGSPIQNDAGEATHPGVDRTRANCPVAEHKTVSLWRSNAISAQREYNEPGVTSAGFDRDRRWITLLHSGEYVRPCIHSRKGQDVSEFALRRAKNGVISLEARRANPAQVTVVMALANKDFERSLIG